MGAIRIRQEKSAQIAPIRLNKNSEAGFAETPKVLIMKKMMNGGIKEDIAPHKIVTKIHFIKVLTGRKGITIIFDRYLWL
ncbi:hypothetical protein [Ignatzschineria sp. LJL83]